jgi:hypothetical protein
VKLLLATMALSIVLGVVFRNHERAWRVMLVLLSFGVTAAYFVFADRFM